MLSIKQFCERMKVSRSTVLYYERQGLLKPSSRSSSGYRQYNQKDVERFSAILAYRSFGIPVSKIESLMVDAGGKERDMALRQQFAALDREIQKLRQQQHSILALLQEPDGIEQGLMTKERWVEILKQSGMDDQDMHNWHKRFEQMEPLGHLKFLQSLNIDESEIEAIRTWSREP